MASRIMIMIAMLVIVELTPEKIVTPPTIARHTAVMFDWAIFMARTVSKRNEATLVM